MSQRKICPLPFFLPKRIYFFFLPPPLFVLRASQKYIRNNILLGRNFPRTQRESKNRLKFPTGLFVSSQAHFLIQWPDFTAMLEDYEKETFSFLILFFRLVVKKWPGRHLTFNLNFFPCT